MSWVNEYQKQHLREILKDIESSTEILEDFLNKHTQESAEDKIKISSDEFMQIMAIKNKLQNSKEHYNALNQNETEKHAVSWKE